MVQLYPPAHPLDPTVRDGQRGPEYARGIIIGDNVWIGGSAIILGEPHRGVLQWLFLLEQASSWDRALPPCDEPCE